MKLVLFAVLAVVFLAPSARAQFSGPGNTPSVGDYIGRQQEIDQSQQYRDPYQSPGPGNLPYTGVPSVEPASPPMYQSAPTGMSNPMYGNGH